MDSLSMFGMEAHETERMVDVLAKTSSSTNTDVEGLADALTYVGANANASNMDIETTSALLGLLADNGIKGSKAGTTLNSMLDDMKKSASDGAIAIGDTSVALYDSEGNMRDVTDILDEMIIATEGMSDEQRDLALQQIFGQQAMKGVNALFAEGVGATKSLRDELYLSQGTAEKMAEILEGGLGGSLRELKSALEGLAISFGETLAPMLEKGVDWITKWIRKFTDLDDGTKKTIVVIGGLVAAIGPILLIGGTLLTWIASAVTAFSTISGAIGGVSGAIALLSNPIGWIIAGFGAIIAVGVALYANWEKLENKFGESYMTLVALTNPIAGIVKGIKLFKEATDNSLESINRFGDDVSDATRKALDGYFELSDKAQITLNELAWGQDIITKKMATDMKATYDEMNTQIIEGLKEKNTQEIQQSKENFANLDGLTKERQAEILQGIDEHYNKEITKQNEANERIKEIIDTASQEKRAITQAEHDEINRLNDSMSENAVRALSENEAEAESILTNMKHTSGEITAQQAAETIQNAEKARLGTVEEAEAQFGETVAWIEQQRDVTGTISAEEADELIKQATKQRDETIKNAEDRKKNVVKIAKKQMGEHVDMVDLETGELLGRWDIFKNKTTKLFNKMWSGIKKAWNESTKEIGKKASELKNDVVKKYNDLKTKAINTFNSLKTKAISIWNGIKSGVSTAISNTASTIGKKVSSIKNSIASGFNSAKSSAISKFNELKSGISKRISDTRSKVSSGVSKIKGYFSKLRLKIPSVSISTVTKAKSKISSAIKKIKGFFSGLRLRIPSIKLPRLPRIRITGSFSLTPPRVPRISWNALGGIFNKPTIFNTANAGMQGVGEAGAEAILPLTKSVLGTIGDKITANMSNGGGTVTSNNNDYSVTYGDIIVTVENGDKKKAKDISKEVAKELMKGVRKKGG